MLAAKRSQRGLVGQSESQRNTQLSEKLKRVDSSSKASREGLHIKGPCIMPIGDDLIKLLYTVPLNGNKTFDKNHHIAIGIPDFEKPREFVIIREKKVIIGMQWTDA